MGKRSREEAAIAASTDSVGSKKRRKDRNTSTTKFSNRSEATTEEFLPSGLDLHHTSGNVGNKATLKPKDEADEVDRKSLGKAEKEDRKSLKKAEKEAHGFLKKAKQRAALVDSQNAEEEHSSSLKQIHPEQNGDARPVAVKGLEEGPGELRPSNATTETTRLEIDKDIKKKRKKDHDKTSRAAAHRSQVEALNGNNGISKAKSSAEGSAPSVPFPTPAATPVSSSHASRAPSEYLESQTLSAVPQANIDDFLSSNFITTEDPLDKLLRPITAFTYLPYTDASHHAIFSTFASPTPIQAAAWPYILARRDVIGVAETGSGKTLAFGVPCVRCLASMPAKNRSGVRALVLSPTRELALQIYEQLVKLANPVGLDCVCVYGGVSKDEQRRSLQTASIVIATPGRLNDLINEGAADLSKVKYLVLDEADRMLDKGFEEDIRKIINTAPATKQRQTLMFTATWPPSVRALAATFMTSPVKIHIGDNNPSGELRANARINQTIEVLDPHAKQPRLLQLLAQHQSGAHATDRILIFCLYKKEAARIERFLTDRRHPAAAIHGDMSQAQRTASLESFKSGRVPLLVATDVAARGLDIPAVKLVVNLTFPLTVEDYVHRIGRTGRAGAEGSAVTFFTEHDKAHAGALVNVLRAAKQAVPEELLRFGTTVKRKGHEAYGAFYKDVDAGRKATKITFE